MTNASSDSADDATSPSGEPGNPTEHRIVGIGASAGGLEAIKAFFDNVPPDSGHSFVVVQHLSPEYKSMMAELLRKNTQLPITEAEDDMPVAPGSIYLIPPGKNLELRRGRLSVSDKPSSQTLNLPIDIFFKSLAKELGDRSIGIVLTGTGSDGTRGIRAIKEIGGMVMVQDPHEAPFDGMPLSAINSGLVDYILPAADLPGELQAFLDHPLTSGRAQAVEGETAQLAAIVARIKEVTDLDFGHYKRPTLARRIERRMSVRRCSTTDAYLRMLTEEAEEAEILGRECLIGVTKFFRDGEVWDVLAERVIPDLVTQAITDRRPVRVWSVGCSTGEEVYSLAILLREEIDRRENPCDVKIFATDLSVQHLAIASKGVYPESVVTDVFPERLARYFIRRGDEYEVSDRLRSMAIFSPHNVTQDPPFKDIDLVVCRNLLIYLQPIAQHKAMASLHYALRPGGILMLGMSESLGDLRVAMSEIDGKSKLFRNESPSRGFRSDSLRQPSRAVQSPRRGRDGTLAARSAEVLGEAISGELGLAAVFVDDSFEILHAVGEVRNFIDLPSQGFSSNLLKILDNSLSAAVSTAVRQARQQSGEIRYNAIRPTDVEATSRVDVLVRPFALDGPDWRTCYAVILLPRQEGTPDLVPVLADHPIDETVTARIEETEQELRDTRESLQIVIEQLEATNEELQASNEELMAANEEMQSTNEELQSMNEELHTVNAEHQQKIKDLAELNADMDSLLESTDIGTIFLDGDMRIRKFTPVVQRQFNLRAIDIGRPLAHFTTTFAPSDNERLLAEAEAVLASGTPVDVEIDDVDTGTSIPKTVLVKLVPFQSRSDEAGGVVMSFVDISELKAAQTRYADQNAVFQEVLDGAMAGYWQFEPDQERLALSPTAKALLGYLDHELEETRDQLHDLVHPEDRPMLDEALDELVQEDTADQTELEVRFRHRDGATVWFLCRGKLLRSEDGLPRHAIGSFVDITRIKGAEADLVRSNDELKQFAYLTSHDLQEPLRTVSNFVEVLERRYDELLDDDGRQYLGIVSQATIRMQGLIRGILDYSRIGHGGLRSVVDTESLVASVVTDLGSSIDESGAVIEVRPLPKVIGYESDLRTLFANLLSNAVKFRQPDTTPEITIDAVKAQDGRGWTFSLTDNGIGIAAKYHERIFEIFNRLHNRDDYEGAGIGLAHCRKIVELHGGQLTVESAVGEGSTFRFDLLLDEEED